MMMSFQPDNEVFDFDSKTARAEHRAHSLWKDRVSYQESLNAQPKPKPGAKLRIAGNKPAGQAPALAAVPHGAARTMARTCLAKGLVAGCDDMPMTSMGKAGRWVPCLRKPSVSRPLLLCREAGAKGDCMDISHKEMPSMAMCVSPTAALKTVSEFDLLDATTSEGSVCGSGGPDSTTDDSAQSSSDTEATTSSLNADCRKSSLLAEETSVEEADALPLSKDEDVEEQTSATLTTRKALKKKSQKKAHVETRKRKSKVARAVVEITYPVEVEVESTREPITHDAKESRVSVQAAMLATTEKVMQIEKEALATKERAEHEAQAIKAKAVLEAVSIRKSAEEVSAKANAALEEQTKAQLQAERKAEASAKKEAAAALRQVKELEKQQAKKFKKEKESGKQKERDLEAVRVQAAREMECAAEEASMIRTEAYAIRNKVKEEARVGAAATAAAKATILKAQEDSEALKQQRLQEVAQAEADFARSEAELEAKRAALDQEVMELQTKAQADVNAKMEVVAKVQRDAQSAKEHAEQEARLIKETAVLAALSVRRTAEVAVARAKAQLESQVEAASRAERDAKNLAEKEAAASLKKVKELGQQRAKKFRKESELERQMCLQRERELEIARQQAAEEKAQAVAEAARIRADAYATRNKIKEEARSQALADATAIRATAEAELHEARALSQQLLQAESADLDAKALASNTEKKGEVLAPMSEQMPVDSTDALASFAQVVAGDVDWELVSCTADRAIKLHDQDGCIEHEGEGWALLE